MKWNWISENVFVDMWHFCTRTSLYRYSPGESTEHSSGKRMKKERRKSFEQRKRNNINWFSTMISVDCQLLSLHINRSVHIFYFIPFAHVILIFHPHSTSFSLRVIIFILLLFMLHCDARPRAPPPPLSSLRCFYHSSRFG